MQPHIYRAVVPGTETLQPGTDLPRHRHGAGYATIVLTGSFVEASFAGRFHVEPGDVLLHAAFDCHANWMVSARGVQLLRLPWSDALEGRFWVRDPDWLTRLCEQDPLEASEELPRLLQVARERDALDWPSQLAVAMSNEPSLSLRQFAASRHLSPAALSRGFRRAFGVPPRQFRLETRARRAWAQLLTTRATLTEIACALEFADLAHMSRSVSALTGFSPSAWRAAPSATALLGQLRSSRDSSALA